MTDDKIRENRVRRALARQGYQLVKSRRRDPRALGYGGYMITDPNTNTIVAGEVDSHQALTLDDAEAWTTRAGTDKVTVLMTVDPYRRTTPAQRDRFKSAIENELQPHFRGIVQPSVQWDEQRDQALVTLASYGNDAADAGERAKGLVMAQAQNVAHIYVKDAEVVEIAPTGW